MKCSLCWPRGRGLRCFSTARSANTSPWDNGNSQRLLFDRIAQDLGLKQLADWYDVSAQQVTKRGGKGLFSFYPSLGHALQATYPDYPWLLSKFHQSSHTESNQAEELKKDEQDLKMLIVAEARLGISQPEDWYAVTLLDLKEAGVPARMNRRRLSQLLALKYPHCRWDIVQLLKGRFAQQKRLERMVASFFPDEEMLVNTKKETKLINPETGNLLELDIYFPSLHLAFEYQERHHYMAAPYSYEPVEKIIERDRAKQQLAKEKGITLLTIPCWWANTKESLLGTIKKARPELINLVRSRAPPSEFIIAGDPISDIPPPRFFDRFKIPHIEDIGQPPTACFFTLSKVNPEKWWMFEKYDGVRGFWNPNKRLFYSRNGNPIRNFPQHIIDSMPPDLFLDGELWFGRENFLEATKLSSRADPSRIDWNKFKYVVFDVPNHNGTYAERYNKLVEYFGKRGTGNYVDIAKAVVCRDATHLEEFYQDVMDAGGEGIILRNPEAPYEHGTAPGYLKHKKYRDAEAKIVRVESPQHWECELPNGVRFTAPAGTTEFSKRWSPQTGDIVSFKHHGFLAATQKPKFPSLYRLRLDLSWADVVYQWEHNTRNRLSGTSIKQVSSRRTTATTRPKGYWQDKENRKRFFTQFAEKMGFNPLNGDKWLQVTNAQINAAEGGGLLAVYNGALPLALTYTFKDLTFPERKANQRETEDEQRAYWDIEKRQTFFINFAKEMGFDYLNLQHWRTITKTQIRARPGGWYLLSLYRNSLTLALQQTFSPFSQIQDHQL